MFDNANKKDIRALEKEAKLAESNRIAYTRTIMSTIYGRAWMHNLLLRCNVFSTPFVRGDSHATSFNCGNQNVGLQLFGDVAAHCPHEYSLMMTEASIKDEANARRTESNRESDPSARSESPAAEPRWHDSGAVFTIDAEGYVIDQSAGTEAGTEDTGAREEA